MKAVNTSHYIFIATLLCQSLMAQSNFREAILIGVNREEAIKQGIERLRDKNEQDLIAEAMNPSARRDSRIAAAVLLIREYKSQPSIDAGLEAMKLDMPAGLNDWEEANDWRLSYPVAAEASLRADLLRQITQRTIDGALPESVVGFVLLRYQADNHAPGEHLAALLKTNLTPPQRQRGERMLAILKGEAPSAPPSNRTPEARASTSPAVVAQPPAPKKAAESTIKAPTIKAPTTSTPSEEPASSTPWSIIIVLIVAAIGLLWLLLKRRS